MLDRRVGLEARGADGAEALDRDDDHRLQARQVYHLECRRNKLSPPSG